MAAVVYVSPVAVGNIFVRLLQWISVDIPRNWPQLGLRLLKFVENKVVLLLI